MYKLLQFFLQLALLRRTPQELPDSRFLLAVLLLLNLVLNTFLGIKVFETAGHAILANLLELALAAGLLFAALHVQNRLPRWRQTYTALLGLGALAALFSLGFVVVGNVLDKPLLPNTLNLLLFFWMQLALAHVVRHAFEMALPFAILIVFAYTLFALGLIAQWIPIDPDLAVDGISNDLTTDP